MSQRFPSPNVTASPQIPPQQRFVGPPNFNQQRPSNFQNFPVSYYYFVGSKLIFSQQSYNSNQKSKMVNNNTIFFQPRNFTPPPPGSNQQQRPPPNSNFQRQMPSNMPGNTLRIASKHGETSASACEV